MAAMRTTNRSKRCRWRGVACAIALLRCWREEQLEPDQCEWNGEASGPVCRASRGGEESAPGAGRVPGVLGVKRVRLGCGCGTGLGLRRRNSRRGLLTRVQKAANKIRPRTRLNNAPKVSYEVGLKH